MAETQLVYDNNRKCLGIRVREVILTPGNGLLSNIALKVQGVLNTRTGEQAGPIAPTPCAVSPPAAAASGCAATAP